MAGGVASSRMMDMLVTDLPQPDSPTMARVWLGNSEKETPSTAQAIVPSVEKWVFNPETSSSGVSTFFHSLLLVLGSMASRMDSPMMLYESTVRKIMMPGGSAS